MKLNKVNNNSKPLLNFIKTALFTPYAKIIISSERIPPDEFVGKWPSHRYKYGY